MSSRCTEEQEVNRRAGGEQDVISHRLIRVMEHGDMTGVLLRVALLDQPVHHQTEVYQLLVVGTHGLAALG